ncbi:MAG: MFS transporter [Rudaea sp.]|uniref:MFS transporter n=1 Tax=unclassified Rudaea TaxID=2627037 RepID=UPI0010F82F78|nr:MULTISPECIES: MFS transporter [unclassified Rudaea]MBN8885030.1 MFS transporter [Rudaea sp.]MBR0347851.1 MFS transporter [Rudaea sp.]
MIDASSSAKPSPAIAGGGQGPLSLGKLLAYSGPAIPMNILFVPLVIYLPPFYSTDMRLDLATVGLIFFLVRMWDAVLDQVMGYVSDRVHTRYGRRRIWMLAAVPLLMLAAKFLLDPPAGAGYAHLWICVFVFYCAWTMLQIPYLSWGAELSDNYLGRNRITSFREAAGMVGIVLAVLLPLLVLPESARSIHNILAVVLVAALVLLPTTVLFAAASVGENRIEQTHTSFFAALRAVAANKPFLRLMAAYLIGGVATSIYNACVVFLIDVGMNLPGSFLLLVVTQYLSGIVCVPLLMMAVARIGKHRALCLGIGGTSLALLGMAFVQPGVLWQGVLPFVVLGPAVAASLLLPSAIVADTVDLDMLRTGESRAGQYMAVLNFVAKMGIAIGVGIGLPLLGWLGYQPNAQHGPDDIRTLHMVGLFLPALMCLPAIALLWNFPLGRRESALLQRRLQDRSRRRTPDEKVATTQNAEAGSGPVFSAANE